MKFDTRLQQLRRKNNLTQSDIAKVLGLKPTAISNYESKRNEPSIKNLIALSRFFDVSCDYLLGVTDSNLPAEKQVLDNDVVEFVDLYKQLTHKSTYEIKSYMQYLIYKEKNKIN